MKRNVNIPQKVLENIDFINTVNGGMTVSEIDLQRNQSNLTVKIRTSGISTHDLNVEIVKNCLTVSHLIPIFGDKEKTATHFLSTMQIPMDVNTNRIMACYEDGNGQLLIQFPFKAEDPV